MQDNGITGDGCREILRRFEFSSGCLRTHSKLRGVAVRIRSCCGNKRTWSNRNRQADYEAYVASVVGGDREAPPALRRKALEAVREVLAPSEGPDGVVLGSAIWVATARNPNAS